MGERFINLQRFRFIANGTITIFVLLLIVSRLMGGSSSIYYWLWGIPSITVSTLEIYFLTRSLMKQPKNIDTRFSTFAISLGATVGFGIVAIAIPYSQFQIPHMEILHPMGTVLSLLPYPFVIWAMLCLKDCLTLIPEAHTVVAHGIYKYSRHPLYVCYIIWAVANIMLFPAWPMLVASVAHIALLVWRLRREEQLLLATFPEYRQYYMRTGLCGNIFL